MTAAADEHPDGQVLRALHEVGERLPRVAHALLAGEQAGVHRHQAVDALRVLDRQPQADRPAPVVHDEGRPAHVEVLQQRGRHRHVAVVGVPVAVHRLVGAPEAREVGQDRAVARLEHGRDELAPEEAPGRLAVPEHDGRPLALVHVREAQPVDLPELRLPGEAGQALEQHVRRADGVGHPPGSTRSSNGRRASVAAGRRDVDRAGLAHPGDGVEHLEAVEHELEGARLAAGAVAARHVEGPAGRVQRVVARRLAVAAHQQPLVGARRAPSR